MMKLARELVGHGHRPQMIETVLAVNGFPEAMEFIDQPHIYAGVEGHRPPCRAP
jgi:hypothetical protein